MQTNFLTNVLLAVIAGLLLVQVIQNGMNSNSRAASSYESESSAPSMSRDSQRNPTVQDDAPMMAHSMFEQALIGFPEGCDKSRILAECNSAAAKAVRAELNQLSASGKNPREVFDIIINKYGIDVLTDEAKRIRGARTGKAPK